MKLKILLVALVLVVVSCKDEPKTENEQVDNQEVKVAEKTFKLTLNTVVSKNAGKRNAYKKKPLLDWKSSKQQTNRIFRIEPPYPMCCEPNVPGNKWNGN